MESFFEQAFETARAPWPDLSLTAAQFTSHLMKCLAATGKGEPALALRSMHLSDLYLACACANGAPGAVEALDRDYLAKLPGILRRHRHSPEAIEDVCQRLREKLLLQAHIATYTGEGKLASWVEVIAKRMANKETRPEVNESSGMSRIVEGFAGTGDLEKDVLKRNLLTELQSALRAAGSTLTDEQRELLKFHYRNGMSEAKLAVLFKTSQPTISRRLRSAREVVFAETKRRLRERLGLAEQDFDSFIADVQSRWLDLTLSQLFGDTDGQVPPQ